MAAGFAVNIAPRALADVASVARWWRKNRLGAPRLFQQELKQAFAEHRRVPGDRCSRQIPADPDVRVVVLRRSGYVVFYDVDHDETEIQVVRVRHGRRRPVKRR
jgi:plasmid stabilization system protein ParE